MAKTIDEKILECEKQIQFWTDKKKDLVEKQRELQKKSEEKQAKDFIKFLKDLGVSDPNDIEKIKDDIKNKYADSSKNEASN